MNRLKLSHQEIEQPSHAIRLLIDYRTATLGGSAYAADHCARLSDGDAEILFRACESHGLPVVKTMWFCYSRQLFRF